MSDHRPDRGIRAVAIGASSGGAEALTQLLSQIPADFQPSIFIVMHLPRSSPSLLVEIFQHRCALPVREACDKDLVQPGTVYVAPPDYHLMVDRGPSLALSVDEPVCFSRPSVDVLFESAADVYGSALLGIVLTGANDDGALGLRAIHDAGGATVVQHPDDAKVAMMPAAARQRVPLARALSLMQISDLLATVNDRGNP